MSPVRALKNQYRGINAHLHSYWQGTGKWNRFHNFHIGQLMELLTHQLLPMGYTAEMEESLQIRRLDATSRRPVADILISDLNPSRSPAHPAASSPDIQTMALPAILEEAEDIEHPYFAVAIYDLDDSGTPVAWVELLSPTNKGNSRDAVDYTHKRQDLLRSGLVFVELDYLHETPPTLPRLSDYTRRESNAFPYRIAVLDPRPDYAHGLGSWKEFSVDDPIPQMPIQLNGDDVLRFDFGEAYQKTFVAAAYGLKSVDYAQLPLNFERYSPSDQARIVNRMLAVLKASEAKHDIEADSPLPTKNLSLVDALAQLKILTTNG